MKIKANAWQTGRAKQRTDLRRMIPSLAPDPASAIQHTGGLTTLNGWTCRRGLGITPPRQRRTDIRRMTPSLAPDPASAIQQTQRKHETLPARDHGNHRETKAKPEKNNSWQCSPRGIELKRCLKAKRKTKRKPITHKRNGTQRMTNEDVLRTRCSSSHAHEGNARVRAMALHKSRPCSIFTHFGLVFISLSLVLLCVRLRLWAT